MRKRGAQGRQKVQVVACPCCEARLALHFLHGENEVYDVEMLPNTASDSSTATATATTAGADPVGNQSRAGSHAAEGAALVLPKQCPEDDQQDKPVEAATQGLGTISEVHASTSVKNEPEVLRELVEEEKPPPEQLDRKDFHDPQSAAAPGSSKLFSLFYRPKKTVHLVRHGHTPFLTGLPEIADRFDVRLDSLGHQQARSIAPKLALVKPDVVRLVNTSTRFSSYFPVALPQIFVSPLTRALQTLCDAFPSAQEAGKRWVEVTALHAEHVMCSGDVGRPPQVLAKEYPWLSFEALPEVWWYSQPHSPNDALTMKFSKLEPMGEMRKRVGVFRQFLLSRPENVIVVIGHSTFFKELTSSRQRMLNCEIRTLIL